MRERLRRLTLCIAALIVAAVPAASAPRAGAAASDPEVRLLALLRARVKYVFVIYQENRSFDSYFGTYPGADGLYSKPAAQTPGFEQTILNVDGTNATIVPFRIGPAQFAADTDDVDHSHSRIDAKMDVADGVPRMDRFALTEEKKYSPSGNPTLVAKQFGELAMAHEDCDTVPFLWRYAKNFVLFDHVFQSMTGPSTPGNLAIIAAQTGITQMLLHPEQESPGNGDAGAGVPVLDDADPFWGSPSDHSAHPMPVNPHDFPGYETQSNLTFASLALTMEGHRLRAEAKRDADPAGDLNDVRSDIEEISLNGPTMPWGWYEEGYDREPTDDDAGPLDAQGSHASYVTHHNGPQYFGYVANNPAMRAHLHGLDDLLGALDKATLPRAGGVSYVKGGYKNIFGLEPADPDKNVRKNFRGDDDHPAYSDAQISEAMVAQVVTASHAANTGRRARSS